MHYFYHLRIKGLKDSRVNSPKALLVSEGCLERYFLIAFIPPLPMFKTVLSELAFTRTEEKKKTQHRFPVFPMQHSCLSKRKISGEWFWSKNWKTIFSFFFFSYYSLLPADLHCLLQAICIWFFFMVTLSALRFQSQLERQLNLASALLRAEAKHY